MGAFHCWLFLWIQDTVSYAYPRNEVPMIVWEVFDVQYRYLSSVVNNDRVNQGIIDSS